MKMAKAARITVAQIEKRGTSLVSALHYGADNSLETGTLSSLKQYKVIEVCPGQRKPDNTTD
jgi:hypothetical protein